MGNESVRLLAYSIGGIIVAECLLLILIFWKDHFGGRRQLRSARPAMAVLVVYALIEIVPNTLLVVKAGNSADSLSASTLTLILLVIGVKMFLVVSLGSLIVEFGKRLRGERLTDGTTTSEVFD